MADVITSRHDDDRPDSRGSDGGEDRAQLILITGLMLAVTLVAVVLLLNTVIYTENLATRGVDAGGSEALEFRESATRDIGAIVDRENRNNETDRADAEASVASYRDRVRDYRIRDGVVAEIETTNRVDGTYIAQDTTRSFESGTFDDNGTDVTAADWTLAEDVTATRGFVLRLDESELSTTPLRIVANDTGKTWTIEASQPSGASGEVHLRTLQDGSETANESFSVGGTARIDLTAGTVDGEPWDALVWAAGVEADDRTASYDVAVENGDAAAGTYELTVNDDAFVGSLEESYYGSDRTDTSASPYALDAVYSVNATVTHRTPELHYADTARIAPGERDA